MYRRRLHRRERKHRNKVIIISLVGLVFLLACGYGAFQTSISLNVKGNIYDISDKCFTISDNGDGTCTITDYDSSCGTDVVIPETIKGLTVTTIAEGEGWNGINDMYSETLGVFSNKNITSVTFPDTLTTIGSFAFYNNEISSLILPDNVTYIGTETFKNNQISYLKLNDGLKTINSLAFSTNQIVEINIPTSVTKLGAGAFTRNKVTGNDVYIYDVNTDGSTNYDVLNSYAGDYSETIEIPNVKTIESYAFREMYKSTLDLVLPDTIEKIEGNAFAWCSLNSITISSSIQEIDSGAFGISGAASSIKTINIDRQENAIEGSPWGATNATVNWTGTE